MQARRRTNDDSHSKPLNRYKPWHSVSKKCLRLPGALLLLAMSGPVPADIFGGVTSTPDFTGISNTVTSISTTVAAIGNFQSDWYQQSQQCLQGTVACLPNIYSRVNTLPLASDILNSLGNGFTIRQWLGHVMGPSFIAGGTIPAVQPWNLQSIYGHTVSIPTILTETNKIQGLVNAVAAIPGSVRSAVADGATIRQWLNHVMGPSFTAGGTFPPLQPWNLESIYNRTAQLPELYLNLADPTNAESIFNRVNTLVDQAVGDGQLQSIFENANKVQNVLEKVSGLPDFYQKFADPSNANSIFQRINTLVDQVIDDGQLQGIFDNAGQIPGLATDVAGLGLALTDQATALSALTRGLADLQALVNQVAANADRIPIIAEHAGMIPGLNAQLVALQTLPTQMSDVIANTNGLHQMVQNVQGISPELPANLLGDFQRLLPAATEAVDVFRDLIDAAVLNQAQQPDPIALVQSMAALLGAFKGDLGPNVDLQALLALLAVLPPEPMAMLGQGLLFAGIGPGFIDQVHQAALDVPSIRQVAALAHSEVDDTAAFHGQASDSAEADIVGSNPLSCRDLVRRQPGYAITLGSFSILGGGMRIAGGVMKGLAEGPYKQSENVRIGVHGYASFEVSLSHFKLAAALLDGGGEILLGLTDAAGQTLRRCESVLKQNDILANQAVLLEQNCYLSRNRAPGC